ncbi:putative transaminase [Helianthus annuus]|nr:putative transaminase [Helianthus annuus]
MRYEDEENLTPSWGNMLHLHGSGLYAQKNSRIQEEEEEEEEAHASKKTHILTTTLSSAAPDGLESVVINLDHGDPTMYEEFWKQKGEETTVVTSSWQHISYFSDVNNVCWFLEPGLVSAITALHRTVGNAVTEGRHIVVERVPHNFIRLHYTPFHRLMVQSYPLMTDYLKSGLHKWAGDAYKFNKEEPYIELVTSPNNPDGFTRQDAVKGDKGILIHDLAYYWPQYTPILSPADYDIMLFTVSKSTGHAGSRIGWAVVKDREIAKKMTTFIEINTIGVSKESQIRAAKIFASRFRWLHPSQPKRS